MLIHTARGGRRLDNEKKMGKESSRGGNWSFLGMFGKKPEPVKQVRDPTTWTMFQQDGPNHLGLWYNALPEQQMALTTSECVPLVERWRAELNPRRAG